MLSPGSRVSRTSSVPEPLTDPAMTGHLACFSTGLDSPVIIDSLTSDEPDTTVPLVGILESGTTLETSPC